MELVSIREAARRIGVTHQTLLKRKQDGTLTLVDGKVDMDTASKDIDIFQQQRGRGNRTKKPALAAQMQELQAAHTAEKLQRERLKRLQLEGSLINAAEVEAAWANMVVRTRSALLAIGAELGDMLASTTDPVKCREMVDDAIRDALEGLSQQEGADDYDGSGNDSPDSEAMDTPEAIQAE